MKRHLLVYLLLSAMTVGVSAQSNLIVDQIIAAPTLSFGQAAFLAISAVEDVNNSFDIAGASKAVAEKSWGFKEVNADQKINLGEYCYLLMQAFKLPAGMWYSLFPGSRYGLREFQYLGFVGQNSWPDEELSGELALRIIGKILTYNEAKE